MTPRACRSSPTQRAAAALTHTIWESAAWWLRELNRLPGLAWRENFSVIGRAQSALEKSLSFLSTMPALLVLCSCGRRSYWALLKSRARRASWQTRLTSSAVGLCPKRRRLSWVQHFERKRYDTKGNDLRCRGAASERGVGPNGPGTE